MTGIVSIFAIAVSLALDAFSVSVAGGLKAQKAVLKDALKVAVFFGGFQAGMPLVGWAIGTGLSGLIAGAGNWVAFVLLAFIGAKMIKEALGEDPGVQEQKSFLTTRNLLMMAVATSIDALVVGVTLNLIEVPMLVSVAIIGIVTFVLSLLGFLFGKKLGTFFAGKVEIIGGAVLIVLGVKMLFG